MEKAIWPTKVMRCTQGYNSSYSHVGSYAFDDGMTNGASNEYCYAPYSGTVMRIYAYCNAIWFQSDGQVMCADGVARQLVTCIMHTNDADLQSLGIVVGKHFNQGDPIAREGTKGYVTGAHSHIEVGLGPFYGTGWYKSNNIDINGSNVWIINNQLIPNNIFFLSEDTVVLNNGGYSWKTISNDLEWIELQNSSIQVIVNNCEYFYSTDIYDIVGKLTNGASYAATAVSKSALGGFVWLKIIVNGIQYYAAYEKDRMILRTNTLVPYFREGIDVSKYQGEIDWDSVKAAGYSFAMIRVVSSSNELGTYVDPYFEINVQGAQDAGLDVGAYIYTYAHSNAEIDDEISIALPVLNKYKFQLPIFFDFEDSLIASNGKDTNTAICRHGFQTLIKNGYYPGLYTGKNWGTTYIDAAALQDYPYWLAHWTAQTDCPLEYGIWQYANDGTVGGISGNVDLDHGLIDFEPYMTHNGYNNLTEAPNIPVQSVSIEPNSISILEGESTNLKTTISPSNATNQKVTWETNNNLIATVTNTGLVVGVSAGSTTIKVTTEDGLKTAICYITVESSSILPTDISFDNDAASIVVGESILLSPIFNPSNTTDRSLKWKSNNDAVATVKDGVVVGLSGGVAVITAETSNNLTASVEVTVSEIPVENILINILQASMVVGESIQLLITFVPSNATDKTINWSSSAPDIVSVNNGCITALKTGTVKIVATSANGKTAECMATSRIDEKNYGSPVNVRICPRGGNENDWIEADPIPLNGEECISYGVGIKYGDGIHRWSELEYSIVSSDGSQQQSYEIISESKILSLFNEI